MKTPHALLMLSVFMPIPTVVPRGEQHDKLEEYVDALDRKDLSRLETLLGPRFEYRYYDGGVLKTIDRDNELRGLRKLFDEGTIQVKERRRDEKNTNVLRVTLDVEFGGSSMDLRSFFFDSGFNIEEALVATVDKNKIVSIVATTRVAAMNRLSWGRLTSIYGSETSFEYQERPSEGIFRLFDKRSHELLLWKKIRNKDLETTFYLPNNHKITNVLY